MSGTERIHDEDVTQGGVFLLALRCSSSRRLLKRQFFQHDSQLTGGDVYAIQVILDQANRTGTERLSDG